MHSHARCNRIARINNPRSGVGSPAAHVPQSRRAFHRLGSQAGCKNQKYVDLSATQYIVAYYLVVLCNFHRKCVTIWASSSLCDSRTADGWRSLEVSIPSIPRSRTVSPETSEQSAELKGVINSSIVAVPEVSVSKSVRARGLSKKGGRNHSVGASCMGGISTGLRTSWSPAGLG